jgi:8-oxo-dGTP pyrophosphatase MutT (NUDIX family)
MDSPNAEVMEFGTPRPNEERRDGGCTVVFDPATRKFAAGKDQHGLLRLFGGGVDPDENIQDGVLRELIEESGLCDYAHIEKIAEALAHYHNTLKNVDRVAHATCFLVILKSRKAVERKLESHETFDLAWVDAEEFVNDWNNRNENKDYDHWIYFLDKSIKRIEELTRI